jgi:hypothetical protein
LILLATSSSLSKTDIFTFVKWILWKLNCCRLVGRFNFKVTKM